MSVVPVQALQAEGALVSGDLDALARCAAFLSARAGVPISASRLIAALGDGREATGELDFDGLAQAMRRGGLALEKIAVSIAGLGAAHLPALVIDPEAETGVRVLGLTSRGKGGGLEVTGFGPHAPAGIPIALDAFATAYPGELWRVAPLAPAGRREEEHEGSVGRDWFWSVFREELGTYVHVGAAAVIINVLALVTSLYTMTVYDRVIPNHALVTLWTLSAGVAIAYVFDFVFRTLRGLMLDVAARRMDVTVSRDLFEHLLAMRLEHRRGGAGTTANMLREYATVQEFFSSATLLALVDLPFVILFLGVLFVIAPACAFATAAAIPIVAVAGYLIQRKIAASSAESFADGQEKHGALVETLVSLEAVRGLGAERAMRRRWRERVAAHAVTGSHMRFYSLLAVNVSVSVQQFAGLVVVLAGVLAIHAGTMSMGALVAAVMLSSRALAPLASLAQIMSRAALTKTAMKAITAFMDTPSERPAGRKFVDRPQLQGQIEARDLSFHYPARTPVAVLQDLNLTIRPGERVGILGRIGSGKSTLLKLMMGLYQPTEGAVYHDGVDLRQLDPAQLRAQVAFVAQAPVLFSGTIKENIAIARPEATDAEILAAAQVAGVDAFVSRHPMGYDLPVQERGEGLSIGQRQAIALAQALLKGADVLLLDEPTSAFDESTEAGFRRTLLPWLAGKTLVIVTHKLSMLELVERVILVDGGRIVMDGPKEAVLRALMNNEEGRPVDQTEAERIAQEAQRRVREAQQPEPAAAAAQAEPAAATDPDESLRSGIRAAIVTPTEAEAAVAPTRVEAVIAAVEAEVVVAAVEAEAIVEPTELAPRRGALGPPRLDWRSSLETES